MGCCDRAPPDSWYRTRFFAGTEQKVSESTVDPLHSVGKHPMRNRASCANSRLKVFCPRAPNCQARIRPRARPTASQSQMGRFFSMPVPQFVQFDDLELAPGRRPGRGDPFGLLAPPALHTHMADAQHLTNPTEAQLVQIQQNRPLLDPRMHCTRPTLRIRTATAPAPIPLRTLPPAVLNGIFMTTAWTGYHEQNIPIPASYWPFSCWQLKIRECAVLGVAAHRPLPPRAAVGSRL